MKTHGVEPGHARLTISRAFLLMALLAAASGCGSDHTSTTASTTAPRLVAVPEFADRITRPGVVTINVHVPNEGNIAGTDLMLPFDQIASSTALPTDLHTPLAIYCRSGNMSAPAVKVLAADGYTDIVELAGGYNAWIQSGRELQKP